MDCVNLLLPGEVTLPAPDQALSAGTQLPMPAELLSGVAEFLKDTVAGKLEPHAGFLAKVGANSLGMQQGDIDSLRWQLVGQLREGLPLQTPGLAEHLRQTVAGQLFIDQPRYSALSSPALA